MRPSTFRIKDGVSTFVKRKERDLFILKCLFINNRHFFPFEMSAAGIQCFKMLNGRYSVKEISASCEVKEKELERFIQYFVRQGIVEMTNISARVENFAHYGRQLNFFGAFERSGISRYDYQAKLCTSTVAVVGVGGIGTWLVESLARSGIGNFILIDPDKVERGNLHRQSLFARPDVGRFKVDAVKKRLATIDRSIRVQTHRVFVKNTKALRRLIQGSDLVINASDQPDVMVTNELVSRACFPKSMPHILCGGYDGHLSFVGQTVLPWKSACWQCYVQSGSYERALNGFVPLAITQEAKDGGTLASIASITANIHALEAIKVLTGYQKPAMMNCKAEIDFGSYIVTKSKICRLASCKLCGKKTKGKDRI